MEDKIVKQLQGIKAWAESDRPREKLVEKGKNALSEVELIAILIGSGSQDETAVELSRRILNSVDNNLGRLSKLTVNDLAKFKGIGEAKAISIIAALELGRRRKETGAIANNQVTGAKDVFNLFQPRMADLLHEEFWILLLNRSNKLLAKHCISVGGITGTVVDTRIIFKTALEHLATSLILCHNHPSGNLRPSSEDVSLTKKVKSAGEVMDIKILDHIIITEAGYYSFADEGIL